MLPFLGMTKNLMLVQAWCKKLKIRLCFWCIIGASCKLAYYSIITNFTKIAL